MKHMAQIHLYIFNEKYILYTLIFITFISYHYLDQITDIGKMDS